MARRARSTPPARHPAIAGLVVAALATSACGDAPGGTSAPYATRDSAGIEIIEHAAAVLDREWLSLSPEPVLEIGQIEGEEPYLFRNALFGLRQAHGGVVVLDGGTRQLRYFDATGNHVRTAAGQGGGPGELRLAYGVTAWPDSTIAVTDQLQVNWYSATGTFLRWIPVDLGRMRGLTLPDYQVGAPAFPLTNGAWLAYATATAPTMLGADRRARGEAFYLFGPEFERVHALGEFEAGQQFSSDGGWSYVPFMTPSFAAAGGDPVRVYVSDGRAYELRQYDGDATLLRVIRIDASPDPPSPADIEDWQTRLRTTAERRGDAASTEREIRDTPIPATLPPFRSLWVDRIGRLWAERYEHVDAPSRFLVFDATGAVLGNVIFPEPFFVMDIGANYVLGTWFDDRSVEFVRLYQY